MENSRRVMEVPDGKFKQLREEQSEHYSVLPDKHDSGIPLLSECDELPSSALRRHNRSSRALKYRIFMAVSFLCILVAVAYGSYTLGTHRSRRAELGSCGTSIEEAKAKGCVFDYLSFHWVRPECYYGDLMAEYRNRTNTTYYYTRDLYPSNIIPFDEIMAGKYLTAWAKKEHHQAHCSYLYQMTSQALGNHLPIDHVAASMTHAAHCTKVLLNDWLHETAHCPASGCISQVYAKFTTCGYV
ncbi:hypothetical protein BX600DRAFT_437796 [Xylariales sp. PMI_506]|nr:hypothetical protein BX600DRAFT_437796 [Xylariales sp. PMI_506]